MRRRTTWLTPLLALAFAGFVACGGGETDGTEMEAEGQMQDTAGMMEDTVPPDTAGTDTAAGDSVVDVSLVPKNESGISGTARLHHHGDSLHVTVQLSGLQSGSTYPAHVHEGTCEGGGGVAVGLTSVSAEGTSASSQTAFPSSDLAMDGSYFVQAHMPDGTPAACGDLPTHQGGSSGSGMGSSGG